MFVAPQTQTARHEMAALMAVFGHFQTSILTNDHQSVKTLAVSTQKFKKSAFLIHEKKKKKRKKKGTNNTTLVPSTPAFFMTKTQTARNETVQLTVLLSRLFLKRQFIYIFIYLFKYHPIYIKIPDIKKKISVILTVCMFGSFYRTPAVCFRFCLNYCCCFCCGLLL